MDPIFNNLTFSLCFVLCFLDESREVFFCGLVGKVPQTGATSGDFCSYITAKLESCKLVFRLHQTLLFRVLRGWVGTCWAIFANIFPGMGFEL